MRIGAIFWAATNKNTGEENEKDGYKQIVDNQGEQTGGYIVI